MNNLSNKPKFYQSNNPTCIDLILTKRKILFKLFNAFETDLSDHHKLVSILLKSGKFKGTLMLKTYRKSKKYIEKFDCILKINVEVFPIFSYFEFEITFLNELNRQAPLKKKLLKHSNNIQ